MMCDTSLGSSVNFRLGLNDVIKRSVGAFLGVSGAFLPHQVMSVFMFL